MRPRLGTIALIFPFLLSVAVAGDNPPSPDRYALDVSFMPESARMEGQATIHFACMGDLPKAATCYLHGELSVDSATIAGRRISIDQKPVFYDFEYSLIATEAVLQLEGAPCDSTLTIFYSGYFHPSNARSPSDYMRIDHDGVFLRSYGYSLWFPVFLPSGSNEPTVTFSKVTIRTPSEFRSVFVGRLTGDYEKDGQRVTEWTAENVPLTGAQCTAQRYVVASDGDCSVYHYSDSASSVAAARILRFTTQLNALYAKRYRKGTAGTRFYVIEMPQYGDISSGNVTGLVASTWKLFQDDPNAKRALAHELVHPYTAVPVDRSDPLYCLAREGFPSYFHLPILAEVLGDEVYDRFIAWMEKLYLEKRQTGKTRWGASLPPEKPLLQIKADEMSIYKDEFVLDDRALLFLNYLYRNMGRKRFFTFTSDFFNREKLTAESFRQTVLKYLPASANDVDVWLSTTEYPERLHLDHVKGRKK
jgi:hypothetical protein